jgi:PTS system mannose-specific IIC component
VTELSVFTLVLLVVWGTVVALDLVSVPQALLARPVVAGSVAGWIVGDPMAGLRVGVLLELFALDVLPIGAVRYPDYGSATVAAVAFAAGLPWQLGLGPAAAVGLVVAVVGGWSLQVVRRLNARAVQRRAAALAAGESRAIRSLQYLGLGRDTLRGAAVTTAGLALAWALAAAVPLDDGTAVALTLVAVGCAVAALVGGALRSAGRRLRIRWLAAGVIVGCIVAALA